MANKKKTQDLTETVEDSTETIEEVKADSVAVGHIRLPDGTFQIISVDVDSKTMKAGNISVVETCRDLGEALYEFKIAAVKLGLV